MVQIKLNASLIRIMHFLHMLLRKQSFTSNRLLKPTMHTHLSSLLTHRKNFSKYTIVITQRINNSGSPRYKESKTGSTEQPLLSDLPFSFNFLIALHTDGALKKILISLLLLLTSWLSSLYLPTCLCWCICICDSTNQLAQVASVQVLGASALFFLRMSLLVSKQVHLQSQKERYNTFT